MVLIVLPNELEKSRFTVSAGRSVGNAVQRNRAKRLLRESLRPIIPEISPGWDILLLSRHSISEASFQEIQAALNTLLKRSHLLENKQTE